MLSRQRKKELMKDYNKILQYNPLFLGIQPENISHILTCLHPHNKAYKKNDIIVSTGQKISYIGSIAGGSVKVVKSDGSGNEILLAEIFTNGIFAEAFVCAGIEKSPVSVIATSDCDVLFFDYKKIVNPCSKSCSFHTKLIENLLSAIAKKSIVLNQKIEIISKKTLREKILAFFEFQGNGLKHFSISMNREEMANYICADRSALSAELSNMQKDSIITYKKNTFTIL